MAKDYSVAGTTKVQRERYLNEALGLSTLDAPMPDEETMRLLGEYVDGKMEISDVLDLTLQRYRVANTHG